MAKSNEIDYIKNVAEIEGITVEQFTNYLEKKPFSDHRCGDYLVDIGQIMRLFPQPPARLLDVGVGSGWTSAIFHQRGYEVLGLDISPAMIELASQRVRSSLHWTIKMAHFFEHFLTTVSRKEAARDSASKDSNRSPSLSFQVCDYEEGPLPTGFDIAVIYDALHHAEDEYKVIKNIYDALNEGGILVTAEPGVGHSQTEDSINVMKKYGTTEKDMPFSLQKELMLKAGFGVVEQYPRLTQLPLCEISHPEGAIGQIKHAISLAYGSATGLTSIVLARKVSATESDQIDMQGVAATMLDLIQDHRLHT